MKKPLIFLCAILIFAVIAAVINFTGLAGDKLPGSYVLADASGSGSEMFKATVTDATLVIYDDDTGVLTMLGQETPVVANEAEEKISFDNGINYAEYTLKSGKLTVEKNGTKVVFKRK